MAVSPSKLLPTRGVIALLDSLGIWTPGSFTLGRFLVVGAIGYLVNQFCLFLFYDTPMLWFLPDKDVQADIGMLTIGDSRLLIASIAAILSSPSVTVHRVSKGGAISRCPIATH
jgi:hypothetical protein